MADRDVKGVPFGEPRDLHPVGARVLDEFEGSTPEGFVGKEHTIGGEADGVVQQTDLRHCQVAVEIFFLGNMN
ncbi:hypothetical protein MKZ38_008294 [Zalerion maritima]|uniref:Uncharacterized protein n=1 Tax=Zalerion maritima TaxID=339359 RepID=A0AAD5RH67_9PEZI|nr:hypothetical protein MKZ38_008294 [Zalerion maritima]